MVDKLLASKLAGGGGSYAADGEEFDREAAVNLCTIMIQADFVKRVTVTDHNGRNNLNISHDQTFEDSKEAYYLITYEGPKTIKYVVGTAIVVGFLIVCLFPVWPMQAKIWVRDGSRYVLMALMVGLSGSRFVQCVVVVVAAVARGASEPNDWFGGCGGCGDEVMR